jgi:predicted nucleic acid-binding protein
MTKTVIDTSTLISLARISYLELLPKLRKSVVLPYEVYEEAVIKGEEKGIADAIVIKGFIKNYGIEIVGTKRYSIKALRRQTNRNLAKGDEAVLSLALSVGAKEVLTNDDGLGKIAMGIGFRVIATPDLLMEALKEKAMNIQDFEIFIRGLVVENRVSSALAELYLMEGKKHVKG